MPAIKPRRIGLAGGLDKDGSRAGELLAAGFGSVEFGSVAAGVGDWPDDSAARLAAQLAQLPPPAARAPNVPRIGVGISRPAGAPHEALADCWLAGFDAVADAADYVSFNLSAQANRPLLAGEWRPLLARSFAAVVARRDAHAAAGRRVKLATKVPLGAPGEALPAAALLAAAAGFDRVTVARSDADPGFARVATLARQLHCGPALIVVGGIRDADDVRAALAAGAAGVQVHRAYVEDGAGCLARLCGRAA